MPRLDGCWFCGGPVGAGEAVCPPVRWVPTSAWGVCGPPGSSRLEVQPGPKAPGLEAAVEAVTFLWVKLLGTRLERPLQGLTQNSVRAHRDEVGGPVQHWPQAHVANDLWHRHGRLHHLPSHCGSQPAELDHVLKERLEGLLPPFAHNGEVGGEQLVDELRVGVLSWPHAHRPLQHPRAAEAWVVGIDKAQVAFAKHVSVKRLPNSPSEPLHVPRQRTEATKGERALDARGVTGLKHSVPSWKQRGIPEGREEPKDEPLDLKVFKVHLLVLRHHLPVVLKHGLKGGPVGLGVKVGEHVGGAILGVGASREGLPEVLQVGNLGVPWLHGRVRGDDVGVAVVRPRAPGATAHHQAHPVWLLAPTELPGDGAAVAHAVQHEASGDACPLRAVQFEGCAVGVHSNALDSSPLEHKPSRILKSLAGAFHKLCRGDTQVEDVLGPNSLVLSAMEDRTDWVKLNADRVLGFGPSQHSELHRLLQLLPADVPVLRPSAEGSTLKHSHLMALQLKHSGNEDAKGAAADHHIHLWSRVERGRHLGDKVRRFPCCRPCGLVPDAFPDLVNSL
mmetsp:Transcript_34903/g.98968  ORF Transcript_34903/g.98968 Transcript_34903/m.98968 type:complete len:561 (+) Transcript_34903:305-1987(+)